MSLIGICPSIFTFSHPQNHTVNTGAEESRAAKRVRSQSESGNDDVSTHNEERDHPQENWNDGDDGGRGMVPRDGFRNHGRSGGWSGRGNRDVDNRSGRWGDSTEGVNEEASLQDGGDSQIDNWSSGETYRARGDFRSSGRGGRWAGRGGRDNGFEGRPGRREVSSDGRYNRGGYRGGGYSGGREEFRGTYRGNHEGYRGGRGGYRGGGRGRYQLKQKKIDKVMSRHDATRCTCQKIETM